MGTKTYRIHPGIGIARLGNSPDEYFIGPESPGILPLPGGPYRDSQGFLKRQGARFRIYEYEHDDSGQLTGIKEITADTAKIEWTVHVANTKASAPEFPPGGAPSRNPGTPADQLNIDAKSQDISGKGSHVKLFGQFKQNPVDLGDLHTDEQGRLIVLGGKGESKSVPSGAPLDSFANGHGSEGSRPVG